MEARSAGPGPGPWRVSLWTVWFGLVSGTIELAIFLLKCHLLDPRNTNVSRHLVWMHPVAGTLLLAGPGLSLAVAVWLWPKRISSWAVIAALSFFAYVGILFRLPVYSAVCLLVAAGLSIRTARFLSTRIDRFDRMVGWSLVGLIGLLVGTVVACQAREVWTEYRAKPRLAEAEGVPVAKNVILVVLDTVRARSLSLYGYPRDTTPNLKKLAERGVRFDLALATAPWTAPSHASMFTGRWSHELPVDWNHPLDRTTPTLAEFLSDRGYATAGFVANTTYCSYETGLNRGFAHYEDYDVSPWAIVLCSSLVQRTLNFVHNHPEIARRIDGILPAGLNRKSASRINGDFLKWLSGHEDQPFFAFLNYFDAHHPYLLPDSAAEPPFGRRPRTHAEQRMLRTWWELDKRQLDDRDIELVRDSYDRCIAYLDDQVGRLFEDLERRGLLRNTLVVITADHGEHLGERELFGHGASLYLPELHVPLLIMAPGIVPAGRSFAEPVSLRDLPATIVDQLGLSERSPFPGRSLARTWSADPGSPGRSSDPLFSSINAPCEADPNNGHSPVCLGPMASLVDRGFHYIRDGRGREELYELEPDPGETNNLAGSPEATDRLEPFRRLLPRE